MPTDGSLLRDVLRTLRGIPGPQDVMSVVRATPAGALVSAINAVLFTIGTWNGLGGPVLLGWCAATLVFCGFVAWRSRQAARREVSKVTARGARRLILFSVMLALPWGVLALWVLGSGSTFEQLLALMVCAGMSAGATFMLHRTLAAALAYYLTILGSVLAVSLLQNAAEMWPVALYSLLYGGFLVYFAFISGEVARQRDRSVAELSETVRDLEEARDRITQLAFFDTVSGLPNRKAFTDRLEAEVQAAWKGGRRFGVLLFDLDRFKNVNDTLGHQIGDELLALVGRRLTHTVRPTDMVSRLGGDEFAIIVPSLNDDEELAGMARRLIEALSAPAELSGRLIHPGTSIGGAIFPDHGETGHEILAKADIALNHVKEVGRGRFQLFDERLGDHLELTNQIERGLRSALKLDGLRVLYQPIFDLAGGHMIGAEALVRWQHPELGDVAPDRFLPVAAERGMLLQVSEVIFNRVASDILGWRARGIPVGRIAINIHPVDLKSPELLLDNLRMLIRRGIATEEIILEVTSGSLIGRGTDAATMVLDSLSELGFALSLDNFGTGQAALAHLKKLPVSEIKIDKGFIWGLEAERGDRAIVSAIIEIARGMGLRSVAEGVETHAQLALLRELGAECGQGFYWSQAVEADRLAELALTRKAG